MRFVLISALAVMAAFASAQISKKGNAYLFRVKYVKGQKLSYGLNVSAVGTMKMTSPVLMTVKSLDKGVATIEVKTGPATTNGQNQGKVETQTVKLNTRNMPVGGKSSFEGFTSFAYPEKPIAVGSTWSGTSNMQSPMGSVQLNAKYKFVSVTTVNGKPVAVIKTNFTGNMMGKMTGEAMTYILISDGTLLKSDGKMTAEVAMSKGAEPMKVAMTMSIARK